MKTTIGMLAMFVFVVMFSFVPSANAAGLGGGSSLGGSFNLGNDGPNWNSSTYVNNNGSESGSFGMTLDPNKYSMEYANWNFHVYSWDSSRWNASAYVHGYRNSNEAMPQHQNWSQSVQKGEVALNADLYFGTQSNTWEDGSVHDYMNIGGGLSLTGAHISSAHLTYTEGFDSWYSYPNGYDQPAVITEVPSWTLQYNMWGEFIAPTLAGAQAMGAPFVTPEPCTLAFLVIGGGLVAIRRKRA